MNRNVTFEPKWSRLAASFPCLQRLIPAVAVWEVTRSLVTGQGFAAIRAINRALNIPRHKALTMLYGIELQRARARLQFSRLLRGQPLEQILGKPLSLKTLASPSCYVNQKGLYFLSSSAMGHLAYLSKSIKDFGIKQVTLVMPALSAELFESVDFFQRLRDISGLQVKVIESDKPTTAIETLRSIKPGTMVVARIDALPADVGSYVIAPLLGVDAAFPAGLIRIAQMSGAPIIPLFVSENRNAYQVVLGRPITVSSDREEQGLYEATEEFHDTMTDFIFENSNCYGSWHLVWQKWVTAHNLTIPNGSPAKG